MKPLIVLSIFIIFYIKIDWKEFILFEQRKSIIHSKITEAERVKRYKEYKDNHIRKKEKKEIIFQDNIIFE